jgi:hypothetical protein
MESKLWLADLVRSEMDGSEPKLELPASFSLFQGVAMRPGDPLQIKYAIAQSEERKIFLVWFHGAFQVRRSGCNIERFSRCCTN